MDINLINFNSYNLQYNKISICPRVNSVFSTQNMIENLFSTFDFISKNELEV